VIASTYLPKMEGYRNAGFFEIGNSIYSHYCDSHGNMIRIKFNEETKTWKKYKYETFGCIENKI
jgi:NifU-like protein involved in Fe-S cluster formation